MSSDDSPLTSKSDELPEPAITDEKDRYDSPDERKEFNTSYDGLFSNFREIHIAIIGYCHGFRIIRWWMLHPCPAKWVDEAQYFDGMKVIGYVLKWIITLYAVKTLGVI